MDSNSLQNPSRIKMIICVKRRADLTSVQFQQYWINHHAPLASKVNAQGLAPPMLGYIQNHTQALSGLEALRQAYGFSSDTYDGMTEVWLDKIEDLDMSDRVTEELIAANQMLIDDESSFVDMAGSRVFGVRRSHPIVNPIAVNGQAVKVVICLKRRPEISYQALQQSLRDSALLTDELLDQNTRVLGYTQSVTLDSPLMDSFRDMRGMFNSAYDVVMEVWLDKQEILVTVQSLLEALIPHTAAEQLVLNHSSIFVVDAHRIF